MVKLQKRFAYRYKDRAHYKYVVTVPSETVEELGWKEGNDLNLSVHGSSLVLQPQTSLKDSSNEEESNV